MASFIDWEAEEGEEGEEGYGEDEDGEEGYDSEDLAFIDDDENRASSASSVAFARLTNARHEQDEAAEARLVARFEQAGRRPAPARAMGMARPGMPTRPAMMPPGKRPVEPPVRGHAAAMLSVFGSTLDDVESRQPPKPSAGGRGGRSSAQDDVQEDVHGRASGRGGQPSAWQLRQPKKQSSFKYAPPASVGSSRDGRGGLGRGGRGDSDGRGGRGGPATTAVRPVAPRSAAATPLQPSGASSTPRALAVALVLARRSSAGGTGAEVYARAGSQWQRDAGAPHGGDLPRVADGERPCGHGPARRRRRAMAARARAVCSDRWRGALFLRPQLPRPADDRRGRWRDVRGGALRIGPLRP